MFFKKLNLVSKHLNIFINRCSNFILLLSRHLSPKEDVLLEFCQRLQVILLDETLISHLQVDSRLHAIRIDVVGDGVVLGFHHFVNFDGYIGNISLEIRIHDVVAD